MSWRTTLAPWVFLLALSGTALVGAQEAPEEGAALFEELQAKLAQQGAYEVLVRYRSQAYSAEGSLKLAFDPEARRLFVERVELRPKAGKSYALFAPERVSYWSGQQGQTIEGDLTQLLEVFAPLTQLLGRVSGADAPSRSQLAPELQLGLSPTEAGRPTLDLGLGVGLVRGSWLRPLRGLPRGAQLEAEGGAVSLNLPARKLRIVFDRASGFFRSQTLTLGEGTFTLEAEAPRPLKAFPSARPPEGIESHALSAARFAGAVEQLSREVMRTAPTRIDDPDQLRRAYTAAAAGASRARRHHSLSAAARYFVARRREEGRTLAQLRAELEAELATFTEALRPLLADLAAKEQRQIAGLRDGLLAELPADAPHRALLAEGLEPERVEAAREADRPLRAHLEAALRAPC